MVSKIPQILQWFGGLLCVLSYIANTIYINSEAGRNVIVRGQEVTGNMQAGFWMVIYIGVGIFVLGTIWRFFSRRGNLPFWKMAAKYPDFAYDWFKKNHCWYIFENGLPNDYREKVPKSVWAGPFILYVPKLGNQKLYIFGKYGLFEKSQFDFISIVKSNNVP